MVKESPDIHFHQENVGNKKVFIKTEV